MGAKCQECGDGWITETDPPPQILTDEGEDLFQGYRLLKAYGIFPVGGGWTEQSSRFLKAVDLCDRAGGLYRERQREKAEEVKRMQDEMAKAMRR